MNSAPAPTGVPTADIQLGGHPATRFGGDPIGEGGAVLLVHGWLGFRRDIVMTAAAEGAVQAGWTGYSVDMPGHGGRRDLSALTPWSYGEELQDVVGTLSDLHGRVVLLGCSLGCYMLLHTASEMARPGGGPVAIRQVLGVAPLVDMAAHIQRKMRRHGVTEARLEREGHIDLPRGDSVDWRYLSYVRNHPIDPGVPVRLLYGSHDEITPHGDIGEFAQKTRAGVTMFDAGHFLEKPEELAWVTRWTRRSLGA